MFNLKPPRHISTLPKNGCSGRSTGTSAVPQTSTSFADPNFTADRMLTFQLCLITIVHKFNDLTVYRGDEIFERHAQPTDIFNLNLHHEVPRRVAFAARTRYLETL
jgi:hypothetical protein